MMQITENQVETAIDFVAEHFEKSIENLKEDKPQLFDYIVSEQFSSLNEPENVLLLFCFLVIHSATQEVGLVDFEFENFESKEEANWTYFEDHQKSSWEDKLNHSFENYHQVDLLSMIEDMLSDPEEDEISNIGKEVIFVTAKSFVDVYGLVI